MRVHVDPKQLASAPKCLQDDKIGDLEEKIAKIDKTVFFGNGSPSVVTQLATQGQTIRALVWLVAATCAAVIGQVVFLIFRNAGT